jgi:anthranilate synthase component 2
VNREYALPDRDLRDSVLVVDNYDSFTWNLVQRLGELGARCVVVRNDTTTVAAIAEGRPAAVVVSPGPKTPGEAYGGRVVRAGRIMHGKLSAIHHDGTRLFAGLPDPFAATRYHSLVVEEGSLPADLEVTARTEDGVIMGLRHRAHPVAGVQFHPESIGTDAGYRILENFLEMASVPLGARP